MFGLLAAISTLPVIALSFQDITTCAPVHILVARGTREDPGLGNLAALVNLVQQTHPDATAEAVEYPASLRNYFASEHEGVLATGRQFAAYVYRCPNTQMVLMGLSQGATAVLDSLCGSVLPGYYGTGPSIGPELGRHVAAVVAYSDNSFRAGEPVDRGTSMTNGLFPRPENACAEYVNRIASYCDAKDIFCARGDNLHAHHVYVKKYDDDAAFINSRLAGGVEQL